MPPTVPANIAAIKHDIVLVQLESLECIETTAEETDDLTLSVTVAGIAGKLPTDGSLPLPAIKPLVLKGEKGKKLTLTIPPIPMLADVASQAGPALEITLIESDPIMFGWHHDDEFTVSPFNLTLPEGQDSVEREVIFKEDTGMSRVGKYELTYKVTRVEPLTLMSNLAQPLLAGALEEHVAAQYAQATSALETLVAFQAGMTAAVTALDIDGVVAEMTAAKDKLEKLTSGLDSLHQSVAELTTTLEHLPGNDSVVTAVQAIAAEVASLEQDLLSTANGAIGGTETDARS